jgi:hypothetical protein
MRKNAQKAFSRPSTASILVCSEPSYVTATRRFRTEELMRYERLIGNARLGLEITDESIAPSFICSGEKSGTDRTLSHCHRIVIQQIESMPCAQAADAAFTRVSESPMLTRLFCGCEPKAAW